MMRKFLFGLAVMLAGCDAPKVDSGVPMPSPPPTEQQAQQTKPLMCMPCVGPHVRMDGQIGIISIGPGINF